MENPLVTTLTVTLVGMGVVFAAMGLILGSMALLTRLARHTPVKASGAPAYAAPPAESEARASARAAPRRQAGLRAAAVAVALSRARRTRQMEEPDGEPVSTPWGDYYRQRQLRPSGRGRIA